MAAGVPSYSSGQAAFGTLRISEQVFWAHRADDTPSAWDKPAQHQSNPRKVRVTGYNQHATTALRASNNNRGDVLEVPWNESDNVMRVMKRLEDKLCIPVMYWRLAGDGVVLDPSTLASTHRLFVSNTTVDLVLLPTSAIDEYLAQYGKRHEWRALAPGVTDSSDLRERAAAFFNLLSPVASDAWPVYIQQRTHAEAMLRKRLDQYAGEPLDPLLVQIRAGVEAVLASTKLAPSEQAAVADGVIPLHLELIEAGESTEVMGDAEVLTRIYSPTSPAAIDVHFAYRRAAGAHTTDYALRVMYRVYTPLARPAMERRDFSPRAGQNGWQALFALGICDTIDERGYDDTECDNAWGPSPAEVQRLHRMLFGEGAPASKVGTVEMVRLLMAAVGLPFHVKSEGGGGDEQDDKSHIRWAINDCEWLGWSVRAACGVPLRADAE
ncbi:hypothetical protein WOLCODRAFT_152313 [Wolfiporia cocos MD-104 SS10]|uniref:Uncharacterized protein n=1 Tax=Wolfiporia cocos (strain MD-104) TaxID=742152 RepID=A0A2H3JQW5_WOLCO|nr:hypothetical protein WOLCODRAFT_152313 [Wolfiporia cocos MD-104 SS10]